MDHDDTPASPAPSLKAEPVTAPSEVELSRIARQAVHQPADPRLDRQLARLGVMEPSDGTDARPTQPTARLSVVSGADLERLQARLRRIEMLLGALVVAVGILALVVVVLLTR